MKIEVLERTKNWLKIEIEGEGHTFCNLLQQALLQDKTVEMAGYDIPHPLVSSPVLQIRMRGNGSPEKALSHALAAIRDTIDSFLKEVEKTLKVN